MRVFNLLFTLLFASIYCTGQNSDAIWDKEMVDATLLDAQKLEFSNHDSSMVLTEMVITNAKKLEYEKGFGHAILHKGYLLEDIGEYKEAIQLYDSSIVIFKKINELPGIAKAKNTLGILLNYQGKYNDAIKSLQTAYDTYDKIGNQNGKAMALGNMGLVQTNVRNFDEALAYYNQSLALKLELGDSLGIAIDEMNIGNAYSSKGEYETALEHLYISTEMSKLIDDKVGISYCLTSIGEVFIKLEKYKLAEENFIYAMEIQKSISDKNGLASSYRSLGTIYSILNRTSEAMDMLNKGLIITNDLDLIPIKIDLYSTYSDVYEINGDYEMALKYHRQFSELKDSVYDSEKNQKLAEIDIKYHSKLKDEEISNKEAELFKKEKEIDNIIEEENFIMALFSIIIVAILCFAGFVFFNFRKKKKLAEELEKLSIVAREIENTVIIADKHGEIEWINESYTRKHGFNLEEFKEKFGKYIVSASDSPEIQENVAKCKSEKKPVKYVLHMEKKSGDMHWIQTTLTPILDNNGDINKFILIDSDITDVKNAEAKMALQRDELVSKNNQITESIDYAKRIQSALLPSRQKLASNFKEHFIMYKPKDIVSGDFYWLENSTDSATGEKIVLFAAADCTGHGVPGALMSIIGMNSLNYITEHSNCEPKEILETLSTQIQEKLAHQDHLEQLKDGIDICLCSFKEEINGNQVGVLEFSGAHNPLYLIRDNELIEYKGNRIHIGASRRSGQSFTQETIPILKDDVIFIFSDGFVDQKGGEHGKKFYYGPFRDLLMEIHLEPMEKQKQILIEKMAAWKKSKEQLDDILIWGIRF